MSAITAKSHIGVIKKRIMLFNVDNFWDSLINQFKTMVVKQTLPQAHFDHLLVVNSVMEIIEHLNAGAELQLSQRFADQYWKQSNT